MMMKLTIKVVLFPMFVQRFNCSFDDTQICYAAIIPQDATPICDKYWLCSNGADKVDCIP